MPAVVPSTVRLLASGRAVCVRTLPDRRRIVFWRGGQQTVLPAEPEAAK